MENRIVPIKDNSITIETGNGNITFEAVRVKNILAFELYKQSAMLGERAVIDEVANTCNTRFINFCGSMASADRSVEFFIYTGNITDSPAILFIAAGRGGSEEESKAECRNNMEILKQQLTLTIDFAEFSEMTDTELLNSVINRISAEEVTEISRRIESIKLSYDVKTEEKRTLGFCETVKSDILKETVEIKHLFPWVANYRDTWRKLMDSINLSCKNDTALIIHSRCFKNPDSNGMRTASENFSVLENIFASPGFRNETLHYFEADLLRKELFNRISITNGPAIASRIFVTGGASFAGTAVNSIHDPSDGSSGYAYKGGSVFRTVCGNEVFESIEPGYGNIFSPSEAAAFIRIPLPAQIDYPGITMNRSRSSFMQGTSGNDSELGVNIHKTKNVNAAMDEESRFRHTYIIGQTGTGKSTLMHNMILGDIRKNRGVAVLDPHGSLIDDILKNMPRERARDVVIIDTTNIHRPVPFNLLCINETDEIEYRRTRDIIISELYTYIDYAYNLTQTGGPIFETHFRGMLSLMMGYNSYKEGLIPNLLIFRSLYTNDSLRQKLFNLNRGTDIMLDDFINEIEGSSGDWSMKNISTYITSKFNRFFSDFTLRNITCQNSIIDIDDIVNSNKILLVNLGKGQFGEQTAGLLASSIVSRIRRAAMRKGAHAAVPFYLYADEFHVFADDNFAELLSEGRKFGLALTVANQFATQLSPEIMQSIIGNVGTIIALRTGITDAEMLEPVFAPTFSKQDISSQSNFTAYVKSSANLGTVPFNIKLNPQIMCGNSDNMNIIKGISFRKYGRDRIEVEKEIAETYRKFKMSA